MMRYSIIIPAHNEAPNIERLVSGFIESLPAEISEVLEEILIVENGSTDGTLDACRRVQSRFPGLLRIHSISRGSYGEAIKTGMLESRGTHLSILECDLLSAAFVSRSIALFHSQKADVIVGSKRHPESSDRRPLKRRVLTALYNYFLLRCLVGYPGTDTHGLKSMDAACARKLCDAAITTDEIFQTEIVLLAWRLGFAIAEIPVTIAEMRSSPVTVLRRVPKVLNTVRELRHSLDRFPAQTRPYREIQLIGSRD